MLKNLVQQWNEKKATKAHSKDILAKKTKQKNRSPP
jgi:hypothetical protein